MIYPNLILTRSLYNASPYKYKTAQSTGRKRVSHMLQNLLATQY